MKNGYNTFAENFYDCCGYSCTRLAYEQGEKSSDYRDAVSKCDALYDTIKEKLKEDGMLIDNFDAAKNYALSIGDQYIYQQGFQDCVYLLRWLGMLK